MLRRGISEAEVEATVAYPRAVYRAPAKKTIEYYGRTSSGKALIVVLNEKTGAVVTILDREAVDS